MFMAINQIAKGVIQHEATAELGVKTRVSHVGLSFFGGNCDIEGLKVSNPEGYETPELLSLNKATCEAGLLSMIGSDVEIPRISIEGIKCYFETGPGGSNFKVVMNNLKEGDTKQEEAAKESPSSKRTFNIDEILITDIEVHVDIPIKGKKSDSSLKIHQIKLKNIGTDSTKGQLMSQLSGLIYQAVMTAIIEHGGGLLPADALDGIRSVAGQIPGLQKGNISIDLSKSLQDLGSETGQGIGNAIKGIGDAIKDMDKNKKDK